MTGRSRRVPKEWWRDFFDPIAAEVMFKPKAKISAREVEQVLKRSKSRPPLKVLDLACGTGRHAIILAERGFSVTGLDYSKPFLSAARASARSTKQKIRFLHGDMRDLRRHFAAKEFDLVVSLYNSFGYFSSRSDDMKMLRAVQLVLKPGGIFVINTLNRDGVVKRLVKPISRGDEQFPKVFVIDAARYDADKRQVFAGWTIVDARRSKTRIFRKSFRQNVYSHAELKRMLRSAGFRIETSWGMLHGGRFDARKTWHQTIAARKPR